MPAETTTYKSTLDSTQRYIWIGLLGHLLWGSYPVFAKRAVAEVPKFSLLLAASIAVVSVAAAVLRWHDGLRRQQVWTALRHMRLLWIMALFVILRSVSNIVSIELTRATWIQLINILTPFPVALLGVWFFGQPVPRYTYRALILSTVGATLMLVQDWSQATASFGARDLLGLGIAVASTLALATYFQLVRRSRLHDVTGGLVLFQQGLAQLLAYSVLSWVLKEDWGTWATASPMAWLASLWLIWVVQVSASLTVIVAIGGTNPAIVTSMMAVRLVSALFLGWLVLGERLVTPAQWLGMIIVIATVTTYLWKQNS